MKLFVVNSTSPNSDDWAWGGQVIIIAKDKEDVIAKGFASKIDTITEIPMKEAKIVYSIPTYDPVDFD